MTPERLAEIRRRVASTPPHVNRYRLAEDIADLTELLAEVERLTTELARARKLTGPVVLEDLSRIRWVPESHHLTIVSDLQAELHAARQR